VLAYSRKLLNIEEKEAPVAEPVGNGGAAQSAGLAEKRVSNQLIKHELGVELKFPSYREGLAAIARRHLTPFMV
jgi:hypothetical protein